MQYTMQLYSKETIEPLKKLSYARVKIITRSVHIKKEIVERSVIAQTNSTRTNNNGRKALDAGEGRHDGHNER